MSRAAGRDGRWPREPSLYLRMVFAVPSLVLLAVALLAIAGVVLAIVVFVAGMALYLVGFAPVAAGAALTGATDVDAWDTAQWALVGTWLLAALALALGVGVVKLRGLVGSVADEARSLGTPTETLFPGTPTTSASGDRVGATVTALAQQVDLPAPDVVVAETDAPEALTVGYRPASTTLVVTEGLLDALDDRELEAVVAHELAHVKNYDAMLMTVVSSVAVGGRALFGFVWGSGREHDGIDGFAPFVSVVLLPVVLAARALVAVVSRVRERAADRGAVAVTGDPAGLASALHTLDTTLDHPPTHDLRRDAVAALSIVPPPRESIESKLSWDRRRPVLWGLRRPVRRAYLRAVRRTYATHPSTDGRVERLRAVERTSERS